jgi:putative ABC transport system substrate-binding protein
VLSWGAIAQAQQPKKVPRIGYLSQQDPALESARSEGIRLALRELGYIEGQNIAIEYRYAEGKSARYPELAAELVRLKVDIIVVTGGDPLIQAARNATKTIPIVMRALVPILSRQAMLKALPVPAATSLALHGFPENWAESGWSCSKKRFPNLPVSPFSTMRPFLPLYAW